MTARARARWRSRVALDDRGSITTFLAASMVGLLLIIGLIADGGVKVRAVSEAEGLAAEAARAGGQALDLGAAVVGQIQVDRQGAVDAARAYLAAADAPGTVSISPDGRTLEVEVTLTRPTSFVSLIGIGQVSGTGQAAATLVHSVTGGTP